MPDSADPLSLHSTSAASADLSELKDVLGDKLSVDRFSRGRYATDASIYQMVPHGVIIPETIEDINVTLDFARHNHLSVLGRGGGTSQCGQTVNHALVIDNTKYLNKILSLDVENQTCVVEPGIVLDELNRQLKPMGYGFPLMCQPRAGLP